MSNRTHHETARLWECQTLRLWVCRVWTVESVRPQAFQITRLQNCSTVRLQNDQDCKSERLLFSKMISVFRASADSPDSPNLTGQPKRLGKVCQISHLNKDHHSLAGLLLKLFPTSAIFCSLLWSLDSTSVVLDFFVSKAPHL